MFNVGDKVYSSAEYAKKYYESFEGEIKYADGDSYSVLLNDGRSWIHIGKHVADKYLMVDAQ